MNPASPHHPALIPIVQPQCQSIRHVVPDFACVVIVMRQMLVKIRLCRTTMFLRDAAKHKSAFYHQIPKQVVMISLQPAFFISVRMPLIMLKTIAATMEQIAPKRAQSTHEGMLMVAVMMDGLQQA